MSHQPIPDLSSLPPHLRYWKAIAQPDLLRKFLRFYHHSYVDHDPLAWTAPQLFSFLADAIQVADQPVPPGPDPAPPSRLPALLAARRHLGVNPGRLFLEPGAARGPRPASFGSRRRHWRSQT